MHLFFNMWLVLSTTITWRALPLTIHSSSKILQVLLQISYDFTEDSIFCLPHLFIVPLLFLHFSFSSKDSSLVLFIIAFSSSNRGDESEKCAGERRQAQWGRNVTIQRRKRCNQSWKSFALQFQKKRDPAFYSLTCITVLSITTMAVTSLQLVCTLSWTLWRTLRIITTTTRYEIRALREIWEASSLICVQSVWGFRETTVAPSGLWYQNSLWPIMFYGKPLPKSCFVPRVYW